MSSKKLRTAIIIIAGALLIITARLLVRRTDNSIWPKDRVAVDSGYRQVMGTFARIVTVAPDRQRANRCAEAGFDRIELVDKLMSDYKSDSEITRANRNAFSRPVNVGKQTFEVLQRSLEFSRLTDGAFDVTVGPMVDLWRSAGEANAVPSEAELQRAKDKVGYEKLLLNANDLTVRFSVEGMSVDLGGIAKGYAIDKAVEAMQKDGAIGAMVDIGGDIRCFGAPPPGKNTWLIGLQDPRKSSNWLGAGEPSLVLKLTNDAIATSGGYRRFVLAEHKKYSHIIDTKTGCGSRGLASVTIICKSATDADALATAVSVMGAESGLALIENLPETEAILISPAPEYELIKTTGAGKYIK